MQSKSALFGATHQLQWQRQEPPGATCVANKDDDLMEKRRAYFGFQLVAHLSYWSALQILVRVHHVRVARITQTHRYRLELITGLRSSGAGRAKGINDISIRDRRTVCKQLVSSSTNRAHRANRGFSSSAKACSSFSPPGAQLRRRRQ